MCGNMKRRLNKHLLVICYLRSSTGSEEGAVIIQGIIILLLSTDPIVVKMEQIMLFQAFGDDFRGSWALKNKISS